MRVKKIYFDTKVTKWEDKVVVAVVPLDAFSGEIITGRLKVRITGLADNPIQNLSGMQVFINLQKQDSYEITIDGTEAGYFSEVVVFETPDEDDPNWKTSRKLYVQLNKRPIGDIDFDVTTAAGVIIKGNSFVSGARILAQLPNTLVPPGGQELKPFETRSDERGAFALRLRLPDRESDIPVKFIVKAEGSIDKEIEAKLREGKYYSFNNPIDLATNSKPLKLEPFGK